MKIGIDARFYHQKNAFGRYSRNLIQYLSQTTSEHEYICYVDGQKTLPNLPHVSWRQISIPWYSWQEQVILPRLIKNDRVMLMHYLHFNVPLFSPQPYVVTIHDFILKQYPSYRSVIEKNFYAFKKIAYELVIANAIRKAERLITVSEFSRNELQRFYPKYAAKATVIPPGFAGEIKMRDNNLHFDNFFLYVGNCYPHKDTETLMRAYRQYRTFGGLTNLHMVTPDDAYSRNIKKRYTDDTITWKHSLSDSALDEEYRQAKVLIYASRYEGYGLPVLEALAQNLLVICSDIPALRELAGSLVTYYPTGDWERLGELLAGTEWKTQPSGEKIRELCQSQHWQTLINSYLEIYESVKR